MMLCSSFGGKPCLSEWGAISELICDLANAILHSNGWDPHKIFAPNQHLVPEWMLLNNNIPFRQGEELIFDIPINPCGMHDINIGDIICLILNILGTDNVAQGQAAALLAINATTHPNHPNKPIPWKGMEARDKLLAEADLAETKVILGWLFDFGQLRISLPKNKFIAWMANQQADCRRNNHRQGTQIDNQPSGAPYIGCTGSPPLPQPSPRTPAPGNPLPFHQNQ